MVVNMPSFFSSSFLTFKGLGVCRAPCLLHTMMATPHPELEVWGQLAAAMGSSLEEVCNMQGQERDHLIRVILPSGGAGDSQTGSGKTQPVTTKDVSSGDGIESMSKTNVQKLDPSSVIAPIRKKDLKEVESRLEKTVEITRSSLRMHPLT